jgi:hypothetical protein
MDRLLPLRLALLAGSVNRRSSMKPKGETTAVPLSVIGVDIGKDVFHLVGLGGGRKDCLQEEDQATR